MSSRQMWDCAAHPELKIVLNKLESRFGPELVLLPSKPEWLTFHVLGLTDFALMQTLEREQQSFFGTELMKFQILSQQSGKERGVSVRYLADSAAVGSVASG